jgi:UDP-3-O-[3-hydroxymyristoyl] glucosamine N-acyltransferase
MISLKTIAEKVDGRLTGDGDVTIKGLSSIQEAEEGDITFLAQAGFAKYLKDCRASAIILGEDMSASDIGERNIIYVSNPGIAYIKVARLFENPKKKERGVSPFASVAEDAHVSEEAYIAPFACIDAGAVIGRGATVYPFAYVGENVVIGNDTTIYPNVVIYRDVKIGERVIIHGGTVVGGDGFGYIWDGSGHAKIPQLGTVEIEDDVEIGANVTIDRASLGRTTIGKGTKIDNLVQVAHNVSIGANSIIVAQVGIAGSTTIGRNVVLAGQVGVKDHVRIGDNVKAGGGTGITKDVPPGSLIMGTPHMPHKDYARLQGYLKRLPELFKRMKTLEAKLHMEAKNG